MSGDIRLSDQFRYKNDGTLSVMVCIEPWIAEILVPPGAELVVDGWSRVSGQFEWDPEEALLYGWPGSVAKAAVDGVTVWETDLVAPELPEGISTKSFFGIVGFREARQ